MRRTTTALFLCFAIALCACGEQTPAPVNPVSASQTTPASHETTPKPTANPPPATNTTATAPSQPQSPKRYLGAAVSARFLSESAYTATFQNHFNSLTPENEMKMEFLQPTEGNYDWAAADQLVALARGKRVRGHALVYGKQDPPFVQRIGNECAALRLAIAQQPQTASEKQRQAQLIGLLEQHTQHLTDVMHDHITTVIQHFGNTVQQWDVVNEAFEDNGQANQNAWFKCIGPQYVELAFRFAEEAEKAAHVSAQLFYNEYGVELPGPRQGSTIFLIKYLQHKGIQIDGIGLQVHVSPEFITHMAEFGKTLDAFASLGLKVELTELDVGLPTPTTAQDEAAQTGTYTAIVQACVARSACTGITVWGVSDTHSWHQPESPLPIGADYEPKPSYATLRQLLP